MQGGLSPRFLPNAIDKPYAYGLLNLLEFKCDHISGLFQAEYQFQNSNVGGEIA